jgi:hypothetical protein
MSTRTILTLANGRGIDLLNPRPEDVDWDAYAEHLAKEKRFNGATPGVEYSVAEHLSRGVDAILAANSEATELAGYFSLHDAPEAVLKDITTPLKRALAEVALQQFGILSGQIVEAFAHLEERHERAIHLAAALPWPMKPGRREQVKHYDLVMFVTEWRDVMRGRPHPNWGPYQQFTPLADTIRPWDWETAKRALLRRWRVLLPVLREAA